LFLLLAQGYGLGHKKERKPSTFLQKQLEVLGLGNGKTGGNTWVKLSEL
jgi:hypothetical protein